MPKAQLRTANLQTARISSDVRAGILDVGALSVRISIESIDDEALQRPPKCQLYRLHYAIAT
jgi:hypothetical protein